MDTQHTENYTTIMPEISTSKLVKYEIEFQRLWKLSSEGNCLVKIVMHKAVVTDDEKRDEKERVYIGFLELEWKSFTTIKRPLQKRGMNDNNTGWNDKIVVQKKTTLQLYFKTFIEKINSGNLIM